MPRLMEGCKEFFLLLILCFYSAGKCAFAAMSTIARKASEVFLKSFFSMFFFFQ